MKTCLITGANAGIGKAAAIQIARSGYHVIMGCRNQSRGSAALKDIRQSSGSDNVELVQVEMSSQDSILKATEQIKQTHDKLDVLIHNAADFDISRKARVLSEDEIETVWATNHVGPVYMTQLLINHLKQSEQGRIITVASKGLLVHQKLQVDLKDPEFKHKPYSVSRAYYQSKLAQVMYSYWLAKELIDTPVTVNCIRVTNVKIDLDRYPDLSGFMKFMYSVKSRFSISPEEMAKTYTYLATSPEVSTITGKYFDEKNKEVISSSYSLQPQNMEDVMAMTMKYIQ